MPTQFTQTPTSELEAVNTLLATIGEAPVNVLDDGGVIDAAIAHRTLHEVNREVQTEGWHFNTDEAISMAPVAFDKFIYVPSNTLRIDTVGVDASVDVVQRGDKLWDRVNHTFQFEKALVCDLVTFLTFETLPEAARRYITIRSCRTFQQRQVGSQTLWEFTERDELKARRLLAKAEARTGNFNVLTGSYSVARILRRGPWR